MFVSLQGGITAPTHITGKQIIHPGQINIVNAAFSPSKEKLNWASDVVKAFEEQEKEGKVN